MRALSVRLFAVVFSVALSSLGLSACHGGDATAGTPADAASTGTVTPASVSLAASPEATNAGRSVTLSWANQPSGRVLLMPGAIDVTGKRHIDVAPEATTTYQLVSGDGVGSVLGSAVVRVYDWTKLAATLDGALLGGGNPPPIVDGYSFILFDRNGSLFTRAGGDQNVDSVEPLASSTKLPSAVAILTLVDSGKLDLDAPVAAYLAGSPVSWPSDKATITMRMLLNHTSGLPGMQMQPACVDLNVGISMQDCAQQIANARLVATPGSEFNYGGADYQLAGYIATLLSGENWQQFFADAIGTPLGLSSFSYGDPAYVSNPRIAGGAWSNVADYAKILQMVQNGGVYDGVQVLSASAASELQIDQIAGRPIAYSPLSAALYPGYAFGLFFSDPSLYPGSPGPEYSDPGLFGTTPWIDNGLGYGAVILIKGNVKVGVDLWNATRPEIIQQLDGGGD